MIMSGFSRTTTTAICLLAFLVIAGCDRPEDPSTDSAGTEVGPTTAGGPLRAVVRTDRGDFTMELQTEAAPISCANFVNLVQRGFFDGQSFYRHSKVIRQVGNPYETDERRWNPGYHLLPEFSPDLRYDRGGMVGLVRVADDVRAPVRANEFFVTTKPQSERFTFVYPIFGVVIEGQDVVDAIQPNERIVTIDLIGDPSSVLIPQADQVRAWNRALDAAPVVPD
ncbi:MAG: hypothetical protein CMJ23_04465 [Phycisphaerae bacterium]|nr:hypothetical protein [Phycisphaerae bacterium]